MESDFPGYCSFCVWTVSRDQEVCCAATFAMLPHVPGQRGKTCRINNIPLHILLCFDMLYIFIKVCLFLKMSGNFLLFNTAEEQALNTCFLILNFDVNIYLCATVTMFNRQMQESLSRHVWIVGKHSWD